MVPYDTISYAIEFYGNDPGLKRTAPDTLRTIVTSFAVGELKWNWPLILILSGITVLMVGMAKNRTRARSLRLQSITLRQVKKGAPVEEVEDRQPEAGDGGSPSGGGSGPPFSPGPPGRSKSRAPVLPEHDPAAEAVVHICHQHRPPALGHAERDRVGPTLTIRALNSNRVLTRLHLESRNELRSVLLELPHDLSVDLEVRTLQKVAGPREVDLHDVGGLPGQKEP